PATPVVEAQIGYLRRESAGGGYETAERLGDAADTPYRGIAGLLGVEPAEVGFCGNASDAWRRVLYALPLGRGARIGYDESIYGGNLLALLEAEERFGWRLFPVSLDPDSGRIDLTALEAALTDGLDLVALTHMPAHSGVVNDLDETSAMIRRHGAISLVDACQTVGHVPIDLSPTAVDGLVFTGRKFLRAPRGTGGFVVRGPLLERIQPLGPDLRAGEVLPDGRHQVRRGGVGLEQWERNWALHVGLGAAVEYLLDLDREWAWRRIQGLSRTLAAELSAIDGIVVRRGPAEQGGIVVFDLPGKTLTSVRDSLRARGANVMFAGEQNAPVQMRRQGERGWLRASPHYFNTEDELRRFAALVSDATLS
ncbi:MAG: aminotransferase class V-fold PLP-dependent enzyme, partial [Micromonosporaceae bacterium]